VRQRWALRQHFCKPIGILYFHSTTRRLECADAAPGCHQCELHQDEFAHFSGHAILLASCQQLLLIFSPSRRQHAIVKPKLI
jgi:hypothetical protein